MNRDHMEVQDVFPTQPEPSGAGSPPKLGAELKTLFWLQWKLTLSMFRGRRKADMARLVRLLLTVLQAIFTFPIFMAMGVALAGGMILLTTQAAFELAMLVNTLMLFIWLMMPTSYSSQMMERFEMSRLFLYPISFRGIVAGSTLVSLLTITGIWTVPILFAEVVGLAWHAPLALPLILLGALPAFALLVLAGRIIDDLFDLVASDRRLRALMLFVLVLPFMLLWVGQTYLQFSTENFEELPAFLEGVNFSRLEEARNVSEFLEILGLSRFLIWLPPGWITAGMGLVVTGAWGRGLLFLALSLVAVGVMLWAHAGITRKLMSGAALTIGDARVRSRRARWSLPGPVELRALFRKDWLYLLRSPMPRRMLFATLAMTASMLPMQAIPAEELPGLMRNSVSVVLMFFLLVMVGMAGNMALSANYFGSIDREGFASLIVSGVDRRYVIFSANLVVLGYLMAQYALLVIGVALLTQDWWIVPLGLYAGLMLQIGSSPAYTLAAILGPYRTELKFSSGQHQGNLWGMLVWIVATPPVVLLVLLPVFLLPWALVITLPLAAVYAVGLYALTLKPLSRLLQKREYAVLEAVTSD